MSEVQKRLEIISDQIKNNLLEKNKRYGNSALEPVGVFSEHISEKNSAAINGILARLDDKAKRIQTSGRNKTGLRKNDVFDLIGYLILLCEAEDWTDLID